MYWFELFLISFDTFDMVLYYIHTTLQDTKQHGLLIPPTYPGSCKTCFSRKPVLIGQQSFDLCRQLSWMTCLGVLEGILRLFPTVGS